MTDSDPSQDPPTRNIQTILALERTSRRERTSLTRAVDRVAAWAGHPSFILIHAVWFGVWIGLNTLDRRPFDPFPFSFLTLVVSLEAILLTAFVLMAQKQMTREADRREHLDLQVDLLAEQELTAILRALCIVGDRLGVDLRREVPDLDRLQQPTDVPKVADALERAEETAEAEEKNEKPV